MADIRNSLYNKVYSNQTNIMLEIINELNQIRNLINNNLIFKRLGDIIIKMNYIIKENNKNLELIRNDISRYFHQLDNKIDKMQINSVNIQELKFEDGKYVGYVVNKLAEGKGIYFYNNGEIYEGDWKNDKREGK